MRQMAKVFSRTDLVLEILRHLPAGERANAAAVSQVFAAASRDGALWRADLPKWWADAIEVELGDNASGWRNSALALHLHFPAALTVQPLQLARRASREAAAEAQAGSDAEPDDDEDPVRDEEGSQILESIWRLASVSSSAWWHDLVLTKVMHEAMSQPQ
eukprot:COSAG06_NODE_508_length_14925_cov_18.648995_14_plen_160_part_00